jgi:hypothetical protein
MARIASNAPALPLFADPPPPRVKLEGAMPLGARGGRVALARLDRLAQLERLAVLRAHVCRVRLQERVANAADGRSRRWIGLWRRRLHARRSYRARLVRERRRIERLLVGRVA